MNLLTIGKTRKNLRKNSCKLLSAVLSNHEIQSRLKSISIHENLHPAYSQQSHINITLNTQFYQLLKTSSRTCVEYGKMGCQVLQQGIQMLYPLLENLITCIAIV